MTTTTRGPYKREAPYNIPMEKIEAAKLLLDAGWKKTKVASTLGINRQHLYRIIKKEGWV